MGSARAATPSPDRPSAGQQRRSAMPMRAADHAAEVSPDEMAILVGQNIGLHVAEGGVGLVFDAIVEGLDDVFLETRRAGIGRHYSLALRIRELVVADAEY